MYTQGGKTKGRNAMYHQRHTCFTRQEPQAGASQPWAAAGAWFLGPKAENGEVFRRLALLGIDGNIAYRRTFFPCDPIYITHEMIGSDTYKTSLKELEEELIKMAKELQHTVPFFTCRYKGHVNWDTLMPANLGYMMAMLYNQNNCAAEGGPVTTQYELEVGNGLCKMLGYGPQSTGHLVTGGSIANIEAIWTARNLKYFALGLQEAVQKERQLEAAKGYKVYIPKLDAKIPLVTATSWHLLNLDLDDVIRMPQDVQDATKLSHEQLMQILNKYAYECVGAQEFARRHNLKKSACFLTPTSCHVSFLKSATILGIGKENIILVPTDEKARMNPNELRVILDRKLADEVPVICVAAIMGTTEESAVDPLTEISAIRDQMRLSGLTFAIHGDAAWGGYFASMLREPPEGHHMGRPADSGFVPESMMSPYVCKQIGSLNLCDTITIDPHKSGFCPYPAGAICYKDKRMNNFLNITGSVLYYHGDVNLGDMGLEGSKPGAAAAGTMLAHRIVGLHKNGYGRILAQCMFTAKILYCTWATLAQPEDHFVTVPLQPFPQGETEEYIRVMRERIIGKTNEELAQDEVAMKFLEGVGPDTCVPCFAVNLKSNKNDVNLCNAINTAIFKDLYHATYLVTPHRTPLLVTSSTLEDQKHNKALEGFKKKLGLDPKDKTGVKYIITSCMDPWSTSNAFVEELGAVMRNAILCSIGTATDDKDYHSFITNRVLDNREVIVTYSGSFTQVQYQYFTVARLQFCTDPVADLVRTKVSPGAGPLVFRNTEPDRAHDVLLFDTEEDAIDGRHQRTDKFDIYQGMPAAGNPPLMAGVEMKVLDVPRFDHFDPLAADYPEFSTYFIYGTATRAYISHIPTKQPDFEQVIELQEVPEGMQTLVLMHGTEVQLTEVKGSPQIDAAGNVVDPLTKTEYKIQYIGDEGHTRQSTIKLGTRVWFSGTM